MAAVKHRPISDEQREVLLKQGCASSEWGSVFISDGFDFSRVRNTGFAGEVTLVDLSGTVFLPGGVEKDCGIYNSSLINCTVGSRVRISNVRGHIANYDIEDDVIIEDVGSIQTGPGAAFGNGSEIDVLNEAGGREVVLFDTISSQFAYMMCLHRYRPALIGKLRAIALAYAETLKSDRGRIGRGARIISAGKIKDVNVGHCAVIDGASSLINGTILSSQDAPAMVGEGVIAEDFFIAEGAVVDGGAMLHGVYIGQGTQMGKHFSAENSVFFANSEAFHGEACSAFCGPYSVTHHKSTLLIAGLFSFYNAGSGTNQSNHMYKLGPVHEGKLERGVKTGSFSYMMWPCRVGAFSLILGKHSGTFDTADYPFSHIEARAGGKCTMVPGLHLITVGTVRDGAKWPTRDRRKGNVKRDIISFDILSPYTVGRMLTGREKLNEIFEKTEKSVEEVSVGGALVRRLILRTGRKYYRTGIEMYLLGKLMDRLEAGDSLADALGGPDGGLLSEQWFDIGGQLMGGKRLSALQEAIESGAVSTVEAFAEATRKIEASYADDEWVWVKYAYKRHFGKVLEDLSSDDVLQAVGDYGKVRKKFFNLVIADSGKEFDKMSQCGFGIDGAGGEDAQSDFDNVRGMYDENSFVKEMRGSLAELETRVGSIAKKVEGWG